MSYGLVAATFGTITLSAFAAEPIMAIASLFFGGAALITSVMAKEHEERKKLNPQVAMELR